MLSGIKRHYEINITFISFVDMVPEIGVVFSYL